MSRDLNDTLIFVRVVESGGFTAAARVLGLPKATVSRKVQALETRLGARLLKRSTRRIGLTEAGSVYFEHCARIARELDAAEGAVLQLHGVPRGWLRFTAPYTLGLESIAPLLPEFLERHPEIRVDMLLSNERLDLIGGELDLALRIGPLADSGLAARRLARFIPHIYASPRYLERHGEPLTPADLRHHRALVLGLYRQNGAPTWSLDDGQGERDYALDPVVQVNDPACLRPLMLAGVGLALMPDRLVREDVAAGRLRRVLSAWAGRRVDLNAVFVRGRILAPKVRAFIDFLVERLGFESEGDPD